MSCICNFKQDSKDKKNSWSLRYKYQTELSTSKFFEKKRIENNRHTPDSQYYAQAVLHPQNLPYWLSNWSIGQAPLHPVIPSIWVENLFGAEKNHTRNHADQKITWILARHKDALWKYKNINKSELLTAKLISRQHSLMNGIIP